MNPENKPKKRKRTRVNPNAPSLKNIEHTKLCTHVRYAGDVKQRFNLSMNEAVVAFVLTSRTMFKRGGRCKVSFHSLESISPGMKSNMSHILSRLKAKGVVSDYSYDNKGDGYFSATVTREFAEAVAHSTHYLELNFHFFDKEVVATTNLGERITFLVARELTHKYYAAPINVVAAFTGTSRATVTKVLYELEFNGALSLQTRKSKYGNNITALSHTNDKVLKRPEEASEFLDAIRNALWVYEWSNSWIVMDSNGYGVVFKSVALRYKSILASATKLLSLPDDDEVKIKTGGAAWLRKNGPTTEKYESIRAKFKKVEAVTKNTDLHVITIFEPGDKVNVRAVGMPALVCKRHDDRSISIISEVVETPHKDANGNWMLDRYIDPESRKKKRMVDIGDLF